ncbi:peroxisomal biogenesis factor 11-domain-containing protein [Podospora australis]|uniref:Peroxisomal biogenesis factor 11-domain-containing protein n=1 Tax=Podospora australis TaxID=1536484 RepID=A0AAN7AIH9_9PEZI|nr:peroxisomal biogenesis factor 11-domain-containing protein [Podospora australis]
MAAISPRPVVETKPPSPQPKSKPPTTPTPEISTLEHFTKFSTDAYGLERLLRGIQSILQLLIAYPTLHHHVHETLRETLLPFTFFLHLHSSSPSSSSPAAKITGPSPTLQETRSRIALGRRFLRLFRFLENFSASSTLFQQAFADPTASKQKWAEAFSKSFNGLYYLLETVTFLDDLKVPGLSVCGRPLAKTLSVEAQRLWLFALVFGIVSGWLKVKKIAGEVSGLKRQMAADAKGAGREKERSGETDISGEIAARKEEQRKELKKLKETRYKTIRRAIADALDLPVPGSVIKWIPLPPGVVAVLMFFSTWLTGLEVWEKCGKELVVAAKGKGKKD